MAASTSLKEYLKRYESNNEEETKKKKKKKKKTKPDVSGVLVVDEDPTWQKPVKLEEEHDDSADEEKPQIDEDIEVKRMKRLEQLRSKRPYHALSEDGSGWVSISAAPTHSDSGDQNSDVSPPRRQRARYDTPSPEPEPRPSDSGREGSDLSPPRQRQRRYHTPSPEPGSKPSGSDFSPSRRPRRQTSADVERKNSDSPHFPHISSPRRVGRSSEHQDLSPPRKRRKGLGLSGSPDISPPRRSTQTDTPDLSPPRKSRKDVSSSKEPSKTGLISGKDIGELNAKTKKNDWLRFKEMDPLISGRGAEPVYRDKRKGDRISKEEFLKSQKGEEKPKEKKLEWGKGLAQKREAETKQQELELEKDKPFARTRDDPELDKILKDRVRWGDPMAHLVKRKNSELILPDLGDGEKMKESGFIIPQEIPSHSWIKRGLDAAPNRYGIRPGRHWDGVDRSTGFEKQMFKRTNEKQATEREAYLWSVADM
ncbi:hypothetical protein AAG906_033910 [Vitis piasezkii]|uniref:BUD13-like n=2 Tax=Vitis vinifera TaxID=29760 RepID=A0ABY9BIB7_VITVI|eukprot:XP_002278878.1 PREDICTED: BUD13 homolog [Vitis vinifera]